MRNRCPLCERELGDLYEVMDQLQDLGRDGEVFFKTKCCGQQLRAFSQTMQYYVERPPLFIGAK